MSSSPSPFHDYVAGAIAGSVGVVAGHPFDTVKVQLQVQRGSSQYGSLSACVTAVNSHRMVHGFFRGMSWPFLSYGLINSVFFGVYGNTMKFLGADSSGQTSPAYGKIILAAGLGGVAQLIPACPIDVIKVILQSQIPHGKQTGKAKYYKGPIEGAVDIIKHQGIRGMYRGLPSMMIRDVPASVAYFLIFEYLTFTWSRKIPHISSTAQTFVAGGLAGVLSWALIIPFDVIKSRIQADSSKKVYSGFLDCAFKCYKENGMKIFFRGLSLTSLRAFPVNGVTLMVHTEIMKYFGSEKYSEQSFDIS